MSKILVIDDAEPVRRTMAMSLQLQEHTVIEAGNGHEGIAHHEEGMGTVDLVVCDLFMPGLGGMEAIKTIHSRDANVPILVVSGGRNALEFVRSHTGPAAMGFLSKPFSATNFVTEVDRLLALRNAEAGKSS